MTPATHTLCSLALTTALSSSVQSSIEDLDGIMSANLLAEVVGFTGGTSVSVKVRVSRDDGTTWLDVARFDFTGAGKKYANLQRYAAKAVTSYAALSAEGVNDGLMGATWDVSVTTVGTFTDTNLVVTMDAA